MSANFNTGDCVIIRNVPTSEYQGNPPYVDYVGEICKELDGQYTICVIGKAEISRNVYYIISAAEQKNIVRYAQDLTRFSDIEQDVRRVDGDVCIVNKLMQSSNPHDLSSG